MKFSITKASDEFKASRNLNADKCNILAVEDEYAGYVAWDVFDNVYVIRSFECNQEDPRFLDALMRAVAFEGSKKNIRYVFCLPTDNDAKKRLLKSIFAESDESVSNMLVRLGIKTNTIYVDVVKCFSEHVCGSDHAE
ncbi:MAG: hypothetical protein ACC608_09100 [Anaerofustis sp.]